MVYKNRRLGLPDIAEELGVEWILLASIAKSSGEIRIAAQLVDAGSDENRWAQSYTRRSRNVLSMQSEVAAAIARDVNAAVLAKEEASGISLPRGRSLARSRTERSRQEIDNEVGMMISCAGALKLA